MTYARDPYDTDHPPCRCATTTQEFCPEHGDPAKPAPDPPATEQPAGRWVRIENLADSGLPAEQVLKLTAMSIEEYAIALTLVMMHGQDQGLQRYIAAGGHVRIDDDGEPVIWAAG